MERPYELGLEILARANSRYPEPYVDCAEWRLSRDAFNAIVGAQRVRAEWKKGEADAPIELDPNVSPLKDWTFCGYPLVIDEELPEGEMRLVMCKHILASSSEPEAAK